MTELQNDAHSILDTLFTAIARAAGGHLRKLVSKPSICWKQLTSKYVIVFLPICGSAVCTRSFGIPAHRLPAKPKTNVRN